jgi:hypothetical protein
MLTRFHMQGKELSRELEKKKTPNCSLEKKCERWWQMAPSNDSQLRAESSAVFSMLDL